jgi:hypothetical protein
VKKAGDLLTNGPSFKDFRAAVTVEFKSGPRQGGSGLSGGFMSSPGAALVFRCNADGYYAFLIAAVPGGGRGRFKLIKSVGGQWVEMVRWTPEPVIGWRSKLGVTCRGNRMELSINGRFVGEIKDDSFQQGTAGLLLSESGHVMFDDLVVEEIRP